MPPFTPIRSGPAVREPDRSTTLADTSDVIVCGGGPAGIAAALAAARRGARTMLIDCQGCLGGVWTSGLLTWILDAQDKPGIMRELIRELDRRGARSLRTPEGTGFAYDPEHMKLLLEELCVEAGVRVRYHTRVVAALRSPDDRELTHIITESKSGREAWAAQVFIDTTGDGDLGALAGCTFAIGRPKTGEVQPMSLIGLFTGVRFADIEPYVGGGLEKPKQRLYQKLAELGVAPSNSVPLLVRIHNDLFSLCANHEYNRRPDDADAVTTATLRGRAEIHRLIDALRTLGPEWNGLRLVATAAHIGIREGRRIRGLHLVSDQEIVAGRRHEDAICRVSFPIDVHSTNGAKIKGIETPAAKARPYDIPLRALIARDVDRLMMAGRCISGDFLAHSSYRVTGNAVVTGEAAGLAAAIAAQQGLTPHTIDWSRHLATIQGELHADAMATSSLPE